MSEHQAAPRTIYKVKASSAELKRLMKPMMSSRQARRQGVGLIAPSNINAEDNTNCSLFTRLRSGFGCGVKAKSRRSNRRTKRRSNRRSNRRTKHRLHRKPKRKANRRTKRRTKRRN